MRGMRSSVSISVLGLVLTVGVCVQPALASGGQPVVVSTSVSSLMPTTATLEAVINPEGSETSYQLSLTWYHCTGLAKGHLGHVIRSCTKHEAAAAGGTLQASSEPQTVSATVPVEEGIEYDYVVLASNETGKADGAQRFSTPGGPSTGQPWIESLAVSDITARSATIEASFDLEASSGKFLFQLECECGGKGGEPKIISYHAVRGASGSESRTVKARLHKETLYELRFYAANSASTREQTITFDSAP